MKPNPWCRCCSASRFTGTCTPTGSSPPTTASRRQAACGGHRCRTGRNSTSSRASRRAGWRPRGVSSSTMTTVSVDRSSGHRKRSGRARSPGDRMHRRPRSARVPGHERRRPVRSDSPLRRSTGSRRPARSDGRASGSRSRRPLAGSRRGVPQRVARLRCRRSDLRPEQRDLLAEGAGHVGGHGFLRRRDGRRGGRSGPPRHPLRRPAPAGGDGPIGPRPVQPRRGTTASPPAFRPTRTRRKESHGVAGADVPERGRRVGGLAQHAVARARSRRLLRREGRVPSVPVVLLSRVGQVRTTDPHG